MKKVISLILLLFLLPLNVNAKELYLNCEQKINKVRSSGGFLIEGSANIILIKIKNLKIEAFNVYDDGSAYPFFSDQNTVNKLKKNELGYEASLKYENKEWKNIEKMKIIKPIDEYVFQRSSYFWAKNEPKDTITDFDTSGRCKIIEREDYIKETKKFR